MRRYLCTLTVLLGGCSYLTPPIEKPVIEDHSGMLGTFATVAERRMVVTKKAFKEGHADAPGYDSNFCAEPPPDSTQSIASSLTAALRADATQNKNRQSVSAEAARELITTARVMFNRSQGVQIFRDGVYNLCQAQLNKSIPAETYSKHFSELLQVSERLIIAELEKSPAIDIAKAASAAQAALDSQEAAAAAIVTVKSIRSEVEADRKAAEAATVTAQATGSEMREAAEAKLKAVEAAATRAEAAAARAEAATEN